MDDRLALPYADDEEEQGHGGAFERFITSAIATILTIIFSWRLLLDRDTLSGRRLEYRSLECDGSASGSGTSSSASHSSRAGREDDVDTGVSGAGGDGDVAGSIWGDRTGVAGSDNSAPSGSSSGSAPGGGFNINNNKNLTQTNTTGTNPSQAAEHVTPRRLGGAALQNSPRETTPADLDEENSSWLNDPAANSGATGVQRPRGELQREQTTFRSGAGSINIVPVRTQCLHTDNQEDGVGEYSSGHHLGVRTGAFTERSDTESTGDMDNKDLQSTLESVREQYNRMVRHQTHSQALTLRTIDPRYINSSDSDSDDDDNKSGLTDEKKTSDESGSDDSSRLAYYASGGRTGEREYTLGEQLGEDSSDSEYCVIFKRVLEVITEEDTDFDTGGEVTTADTDVDVNDIPADDESGASSDNQSEFKAGRQQVNNNKTPLRMALRNQKQQNTRPESRAGHENPHNENALEMTIIPLNAANNSSANRNGDFADDNSSSTSSDELICVTATMVSAEHNNGRASSTEFLQGLVGNGLGPNTPVGSTNSVVSDSGEHSDSKLSSSSKISSSTVTITSSLLQANLSDPGGREESGGEWSESDLTDSNSIDVKMDDDPAQMAEAERTRQYGGAMGTLRPLTIGPYHDRQSQFSRRHYISYAPSIGSPAINSTTIYADDPISIRHIEPSMLSSNQTHSGNHGDYTPESGVCSSNPAATGGNQSKYSPPVSYYNTGKYSSDKEAEGQPFRSGTTAPHMGSTTAAPNQVYWVPDNSTKPTGGVGADTTSSSEFKTNSSSRSGGNRCGINVLPASHLLKSARIKASDQNTHNLTQLEGSGDSGDAGDMRVGNRAALRTGGMDKPGDLTDSTPDASSQNEDYLYTQYYTSSRVSPASPRVGSNFTNSSNSTNTLEFDTAEDNASGSITERFHTPEAGEDGTIDMCQDNASDSIGRYYMGSSGESTGYNGTPGGVVSTSPGRQLVKSTPIMSESWPATLESTDREVVISDVRMEQCNGLQFDNSDSSGSGDGKNGSSRLHDNNDFGGDGSGNTRYSREPNPTGTSVHQRPLTIGARTNGTRHQPITYVQSYTTKTTPTKTEPFPWSPAADKGGSKGIMDSGSNVHGEEQLEDPPKGKWNLRSEPSTVAKGSYSDARPSTVSDLTPKAFTFVTTKSLVTDYTFSLKSQDKENTVTGISHGLDGHHLRECSDTGDIISASSQPTGVQPRVQPINHTHTTQYCYNSNYNNAPGTSQLDMGRNTVVPAAGSGRRLNDNNSRQRFNQVLQDETLPDGKPFTAGQTGTRNDTRDGNLPMGVNGAENDAHHSLPKYQYHEFQPGHTAPQSRGLVLPHSTTDPGSEELGIYPDVGPPKSPRSCTALATSTALAQKDTSPYDGSNLPVSNGDTPRTVVSAIGNAEATGENPYIAVARATARAATIASANAAAGVAKMPGNEGDESTSDINVVISTSCRIRDENLLRLEADSSDVIRTMGNQPKARYQQQIMDSTTMGALPESASTSRQYQRFPPQQRSLSREDSFDGPKKMVITIEQEGSKGVREKKSRTVECELPQRPSDADMTRMISSAVKRILKSSSTTDTPHKESAAFGYEDMNDIIERVTEQVVEAFTTDKDRSGVATPRSGTTSTSRPATPRSGPSTPRSGPSTPRSGSSMLSHYPYQQNYTSPPTRPPPGRICNETVPNFRDGAHIDKTTYREMHKVTKRDSDDDLSKYAVQVNQYGHRFQYASKPPRPKLGQRVSDSQSDDTDKEPAYIYVTGTGPNSSPVSGMVEEVMLTVAADDKKGPSVEHIMLSETESGSEAGTPIPARRNLTSCSETGTPIPAKRGLTKDSYKPPQQYQQPERKPEINQVPTSLPVETDKKIKSILRSPVKPDSYYEDSFHSNNMAPLSSPSEDKESLLEANEKKPYESILLRPIKDKKTPVSVAKKYESPEKQPSEQKSKLEDARKGYLNMLPKNPPWPTNSVLDAAFEEKKRRWFEKPNATPTAGLMLVDIDIDQTNVDGTRRKSQSTEQLKQRLSKARPKAPNTADIDKRWNSVASLKPYKSQSNLLDRRAIEKSLQNRPRNDSTGSSVSTTADDLRRVRSLGTLPCQFFNERRSYTSLIETDLDTGISKATPLVYETDLDEVLPTKARSLTNLNITPAMVPIEIDDDRRKSLDRLPSNGNNLMFSLPREETDSSSPTDSLTSTQDKSLSAGELRISQSLNKLSIPNWYRSSFGKGKQAVEMTNTKHLRDSGSAELLDSSFESTQSSLDRKPPTPPRPVVIQHRVSTTMRTKSPSNSGPTTPVETNQKFELPSAKLKQTHVELKHMETKPVYNLPPAHPSKKESAKEAYLKLKAQSEAQKAGAKQVKQVNEMEQAEDKEKVVQIPVEDTEWYEAKSYLDPSPDIVQTMESKEKQDSIGNGSDSSEDAYDEGDNTQEFKIETDTKNVNESFPILSYADSPPSTRKKPYNEEQSYEPYTKRPSVKNASTSLDQILGGLLAIPDGSSLAQSSSSDQEDGAEDTSPKSKVFRMLRQARTPRGSRVSLNTLGQEIGSDTEESSDRSLKDSSRNRLSYYSEEKHSEDAAIVKCSNPKCNKSAALEEARKSYKTCHNCYTYYCSRECRKAHWAKHKKKCLFSRVNSICKHIVRKIHATQSILEDISKIAKAGYRLKGRGCVLLAFSSPEKAEEYLEKGVAETEPGYADLNDLHAEIDVLGDHQSELLENVNTYNPDIKCVIEIIVVAGEEKITGPMPKRQGPAIKKCARIRLSTSEPEPTRVPTKGEPETLILTALPDSEFTENMDEKKAREICFANMQRQLRERGVILRHHFPEVYSNLCEYVADDTQFAPMTIYPMDANTGKKFTCIIMPKYETEAEWIENPDLLDELGLSTQV